MFSTALAICSAALTIFVGALLAAAGWFYIGSNSHPSLSGYAMLAAGLGLALLDGLAFFVGAMRRAVKWIAGAALIIYAAQFLPY